MIRLVVIDTKAFKYSVFEGKKCLAVFIVEDKVFLEADHVEQMRTNNYTVA
jgi:hypothetical protein